MRNVIIKILQYFFLFHKAPSASPVNVAVTTISSTSLFVTWNQPNINSRNGIITQYYINLLESNTGIRYNYTSYMTSLVIQSLHPNYIYHITVSAHTVATGPPSTVQIIQLPEDGKHTKN